jgi:hypothetical protein
VLVCLVRQLGCGPGAHLRGRAREADGGADGKVVVLRGAQRRAWVAGVRVPERWATARGGLPRASSLRRHTRHDHRGRGRCAALTLEAVVALADPAPGEPASASGDARSGVRPSLNRPGSAARATARWQRHARDGELLALAVGAPEQCGRFLQRSEAYGTHRVPRGARRSAQRRRWHAAPTRAC